ncbi:MAG: C25 family cysteine peptidase, partial [Bacteroidota bacterium]
MKRKDLACFFALLLSLVLVFNLQAREVKDYNVTSKQSPSGLVIKFQINNYEIDDVIKDGQSYSTIRFDSGTHTGKKGWAELPFIHTSVALPDNRNVTVQVVDMQYEEIDLTYPLLPSRGTIYRNQDPSTIPYETDPASMVDAWYPVDMLSVTDPYIIRDVRGENIYVYPFMYNAVQKKLRIYTHVSLKVEENNTPPVNPILNPSDKIAREMSSVYSSLFINYDSYSTKWTNEVGEYGEILVIYTSRDATVIQPWITWKKEMGYKVHELQVSTGTNVKTNIQTQYTANTNILYVLLVGDWADIKSDLGTTQNAPMDPMLGCVVGGDNYHDIIIGRFSASTTTHVTTQGNKVITYERDPDAAGTWYSVGLGIGGNDGPGDDSEYDYQQVDVIKDYKLLPFTWNTVNEAYGNPTATTVANYVNAGLSVINYCGHGAHDYWVTSSYSVTNVNSSTNGNKLPIVFSVACVVGEFHNGGDCLAEAMLRKSGGGAAATWMATINQPWNPPMRGQDYANDVLTQGYNYSTGAGNGTSTTYGKTTFGSITFNAAALMIAESSATDDWDTYKTWTVFGDPSLQVRTETPHTLSLSNPTVTPGTYTTQVTVGGSPFQNALVSLYKTGDPQPYSGLTDVSGNVTITHPLTGTIKLTVTGFNLYTYQQSVTVTSPNPPV